MASEPGARRGPDLLLRVAATLLTLALLALPTTVAARSIWLRQSQVRMQLTHAAIAFQDQTPRPPAARLRNLPRVPDYTYGLPVLAYHGISLRGDRYTVTPTQFSEQMAALRRAGFHSIDEPTFAAYVAGRTVKLPSRPILITFDDGIKSVWTTADPILERERLRGLMFLITDRVGDRQPYYVTWNEVAAMKRNGRWDFGSHTENGHRKIATSPTTTGAFLTNRAWLADQQRRESLTEWRTRVTTDLDGSIRAFAAHGLPRPLTFADPFSSTLGREVDKPVLAPLLQLERERFTALVNNQRPPTVAVPGANTTYVRRIEVFRDSSGAGVVKDIVRALAHARRPR